MGEIDQVYIIEKKWGTHYTSIPDLVATFSLQASFQIP